MRHVRSHALSIARLRENSYPHKTTDLATTPWVVLPPDLDIWPHHLAGTSIEGFHFGASNP